MPRAQMYLETTDVAAEKSATEIQAELVRAGARQVSMQYGDGGRLTGLHWTLRVAKADISFAMPARVEGIYEFLRSRTTGTVDKAKLRAKAERIAWRQLLRWVQIQAAMIQAGMVQADEVFMPYAIAPGTDTTMYQAWTRQLAIAAPAGGTK